MHILPSVTADHPCPRRIGRNTQREPRAIKRIVDLAERTLAPPRPAPLPSQARHQRAPFQALPRIVDTHPLEDRRHDIDRLGKPRIHRPARCVCRRIRVADDERHPRARFVEQLLFPQPVIAQVITMIARENDRRIVQPAAFLERLQEPSDVIIQLADKTHVGRYGHRPLRIIGIRARALHLHKGAHHRMAMILLGLASDRRRDIIRAIHVVIGSRRHQRPVRLDVGQMQHPRPLAGLADELQRAVGHIGRLGVLFCDPRRQARMAQRPAG